MLSCDLVVAAEHARFGIPETSVGLIAGAGGLIRLPKRIPVAVALELALTADPISAERAHTIGLVNRVVPGEQVLDEALGLAERIARNAPGAVRGVQGADPVLGRAQRVRGVGAQRRALRRGRERA